MAVPTSVGDLNTVIGSNSPAGNESTGAAGAGTLDNYLRAHAGIIAQVNAAKANLAGPTFTGTLTAAALTTTGNTILGDAATDTLNVGNGGIIKDANGNVGIGVAPSWKLEVLSAANGPTMRIENTYDLGSGTKYTTMFVGDLTNNAGVGTGFVYDGTAPTNSFYHVTPYGISEGSAFRIGVNGNVGIGAAPTTKLHVAGATSGAVHINDTGQLYGTALHNNSGAVTGTTNQYLASGTYTPTITETTNITGSTPRACQWMRVGNVVSVSGAVDIDPTAGATTTLFGLSLPIASDFANAWELGGSGAEVTNFTAAYIFADATNNRAGVYYMSAGTISKSVTFQFQYLIL